jgi:hypothetical protein
MELTKGNAAAAQMLTEHAAVSVSMQAGGLERIHAQDWADQVQEEGLDGVQGEGLEGQLGGAKIVKGPGVRGANSRKYSI